MVTHLSDPVNSVFSYDERHETHTIIRQPAAFGRWETAGSKVTAECARVSWGHSMAGEWWLGLLNPGTEQGSAASAQGLHRIPA